MAPFSRSDRRLPLRVSRLLSRGGPMCCPAARSVGEFGCFSLRRAGAKPLCLFVCVEGLIDSNYGRVHRRPRACETHTHSHTHTHTHTHTLRYKNVNKQTSKHSEHTQVRQVCARSACSTFLSESVTILRHSSEVSLCCFFPCRVSVSAL